MEKLLLLLPCAIMFSFIGALLIRKALDRKRWDLPFRDDHERPPGESLRLKIDEINEKLTDKAIFLMFFGIFPGLLIIYTIPFRESAVLAILCIPIIVYFAHRIWKLIPKLRSYQIGFEGERVTAQYLLPLLCQGHFVFHDIPMKDYNVDHVVVGPKGVFAIETKTRRKHRSAGPDRAKVIYDGEKLQYPGQKPESWGIDAAKDRAKGLQQWLSSACGENIAVFPILALPGWYVDRKGNGNLLVMNPKSIPNFIVKTDKAKLSEQQIQRIRHQLYEKSKVEAE